MKLTEKQKRFADYYIETGNITEAAVKAGYSKKTARVIGQENLLKPAIKGYIDEKLEAMQDERTASAKEVLEFLTKSMKSAELLGKRYRLFTDKVEVEGAVPVMIVGEDSLEE